MKINNRHRNIVENHGDVYIGTYERYEITIDSEINNKFCRYMRIKCSKCGIEYDVRTDNYTRDNRPNTSCVTHISQGNKFDDSKIGIFEDLSYEFSDLKRIHKEDLFIELNNLYGESFIDEYWSVNNIDKQVYSYKEKVEIKCDYCGNTYYIKIATLLKNNKKCKKCCSSYDKSIAYVIEEELNIPLDEIWDFSKNKVSPYFVSYGSECKIWIKRDNGSKLTTCDVFYRNNLNKIIMNGKKPKKSKIGIKNEKIKVARSKKKITKLRKITNGERKVMKWLNDNGMKYIYDTPYFNDLLSLKGNPLRPDFILPDLKIWIEYDGIYHYKEVYKGDHHEITVIHDNIKNKYAKERNWKLIRIPYWDFDNIEEILNKELNCYN